MDDTTKPPGQPRPGDPDPRRDDAPGHGASRGHETPTGYTDRQGHDTKARPAVHPYSSGTPARPTYDTVAAAACGRWPDILASLGIDPAHLTDQHGPCPGCQGRDRFRFDDLDGRGTWYCSGGGEQRSGDGFALLGHVHGWSPADALHRVAGHLGFQVEQSAPIRARPALKPKPKPDDAPEPIPADVLASAPRYRGSEPTARWTYHDADGRPVYLACRFDLPDGSKEFRPLTWSRAAGWRRKGLPEPRPLYRLPAIIARPDAPILVCEGEKAADAAAVLIPDMVATTTMNGAQSPAKSDLSPLAGRCVYIWPDHDEPGAKYARAVTDLALAVGAASVEVLDLASLADDPITGDPRELPAKWDAADALSDGWTADRLDVAARWIDTPRAQEPAPYAETEVTKVTEVTSISDSGLGVTPGEDDGVTEVTDTPKSPIPEPPDRPCWRVFDDWVEHGGTKYRPGVWHFGNDKDGNETQAWICSPMHLAAVTFDGQDNNFGRLLRFKNTLGRWREWAMPMELLSGLGNEIRAELLAMGVEIDPSAKARNLLASYLQDRPPKRRMRCALQVGWCSGSFVLPSVVIGPDASGVIFQSGERGHEEHTKGGTLDGWREGIAARAVGNPVLGVAVSGSFVGPLLSLCNAESGGAHFHGDSSIGKTAIIEGACATWGGPGYRRSWRATANGMEGAAALFNDCLLALDEISECDPKEVGAIVYALGNGRGKQRASRTGAARGVTRWRCFIVSSGERTIATTMQEGGFRAKAGQGVRLLDIPAARTFGAWDDLHGMASGAALSDAIKRTAATHHGHAGPAFLERLTRDERDFCAYLERFKALPDFTADDGEGQDKRAAGRFALLAMAGELATEYCVTGWPEGEAIRAAAVGFATWQAARGKGNTERRQILERVAGFIDRHGDARFSDADLSGDGPIVRDRAGWWKVGADGRDYLFTSEGMREALKGFDFGRALDALQEVGALPPPGANGKRAKSYRIGGRVVGLYPIKADALGGDHGA